MKKSSFVILAIAMVVNACSPSSTPMPTATATSTLTVIPSLTATPTLIPVDELQGIDIGMTGDKYGLPDAVLDQILGKGGAPILINGVAGAQNGNTCEMVMPDHLVTGESVKSADNGIVGYGFNGEVNTQAVWKIDTGDPDVNCVAVVTKDGNQWEFQSGTVVALFFKDDGKGGSTLLNGDNPLRIMHDGSSTVTISNADGKVDLVVTNADGGVDIQGVEMGPSFPEGFPREYSDEITKWGYATEINGIDDDVLMVDWDGDGVLEESMTKNAEGKWEVTGKFVVTPEGWDQVTAEGMTFRGGDGTKYGPEYNIVDPGGDGSFFLKFKSTGKCTEEVLVVAKID